MDMKPFKKAQAWILLLSIALFPLAYAGDAGDLPGEGSSDVAHVFANGAAAKDTLDFNEVTHLIFLREDEKLERDVFAILSSMYPASSIFGRIDDIEQGHTDVMKYLLKRYRIKDPNVNDNLGVFTGKAYGDYFTANYRYLVGMGSLSELDAFYVSAYIEESNLLDIMQCPKAIIEQDNGINDISQCGIAYTDNPEIVNVYHALAEGSKEDLRAYVGAIESVIGAGAYKAQVLPQTQVDEILGRFSPAP